MISPPAPDWEDFLRRHADNGDAELDLTTLQPGDHLLVLTKNTAYAFTLSTGTEALLTTNRTDRPAGMVRINGCTFGASSSIKPDAVFCGGSLEFVRPDTHEIFTTTAITALQIVRADQPDQLSDGREQGCT
jgi:hypothetical protein